MASSTIDYDALAKQNGAVSSTPAQPAGQIDYDALAKQHGAVSSELPVMQQPQGSGVGRFVQNFWDKGLGGVVDMGKAAIDLAVQGGRAASGQPVLPTGAGGEMANSIQAGHVEQAKKMGESVSKAVEAVSKGRIKEALSHYTEGFGHGIAMVTPGGPVAASIAEKAGGEPGKMDKYGNVIESGKAPDLAGAAGGAAGLLTGPAILRGAGKLAPKVGAAVGDRLKFPSTLNPVEQEAVDFARTRNIPLSPGTITGNRGLQHFEAVTQASPLGAETGAAFRRGTEAGIQRVAGELSDQAHPAPATPESVGTAIPATMDRSIAQLSDTRDAAYEKAWEGRQNPAHDELVPVRTKRVAQLDAEGKPTGFFEQQPVMDQVNMPVDVRALKVQAAPLLEEMQWMPASERSASAGYAALSKLVKGDDYIPAWAAEKGLSGLKTMARLDDAAGVRNSGQGIAAGLIPDLQDAIDAAVAKTGDEALRNLHEGRAVHAQVMEVEDVAKKLRAKEPVKNFGRLVGPQDTNVGFLRQVQELAPDQMQPVGRAWLQQQIERATREGGFSKTKGLLEDWRNLGPETKQILFPQAAVRNGLDNLFKVADMAAHAPNPSGTALAQSATSLNPVRQIAGYIGSKLFFTPKGISLLTDAVGAGSPGAAAIANAKVKAYFGARGTGPGGGGLGAAASGQDLEGGPGATALQEAKGRAAETVAGNKAKLTGKAVEQPAAAAPGLLGNLSKGLDDQANAALDRVRARGTLNGTKLNAAVPVDDLADMAIWGAAKLAKGTVDFAKWSKEMVQDAGAAIKPHLQELYAKAQKIYDGHVEKTAGNLTSTKEMIKLYRAGKAGEDWYKYTQKELEQHFGEDAPLFVDMLAATSPNSTVASNVTLALKAYTQHKTGQPFSGFMPAVIGNLEKVVRGEVPTGPKVSSFKANLFGDPEPVTVDRWMARAMGWPSDNLTGAQYKFLDYTITQAAKKAGVEPRQMQAAVWKSIKDQQGRAGNTAESFEQVLARNVRTKPELSELLKSLREARPAGGPAR